LVGTNYWEIIDNCETDALVFFYSLEVKECREFIIELLKVASYLKYNNNIAVYQIDIGENEVFDL